MKSSIIAALRRKHVKLTTPENYPKPGAPLKNNTQENQDMENIQTTGGCEALITQLQEGITGRDKELDELIAYRSTLIEDAALGLNGAAKLLADTDKQIDFRNRDREVKRQALDSVNKRLERAREVLAREKEKQRELSMGVIAREIITHAEAYSQALATAAGHGDEIKALSRKMQMLATPGPEQQWLQRLEEPGIFLCAAEHSGLTGRGRSIYTTPYDGPRRHIISLDQAFRLTLDRWIMLAEPEPETEPEPASENREGPLLVEAAGVVN